MFRKIERLQISAQSLLPAELPAPAVRDVVAAVFDFASGAAKASLLADSVANVHVATKASRRRLFMEKDAGQFQLFG